MASCIAPLDSSLMVAGRAQGGKTSWVFLLKINLVLFLIFFSFVAKAHSQEAVKTLTAPQPWTRFYPYIPEKIEYNFELGSMWEASNLYWLGGSLGFHMGPCMFSPSQTCQQYADFIGGSGGSSGFTNGVLFSSLRWQYTDLNKSFVPHARILLGVLNHRDEDRDRSVFAYGVGYGLTTAVHERLDLKFELRVGSGDQLWSQSFVSFSLKFDKFVDYFAKKLESMGVAGKFVKGTAEVTGSLIKSTVEASGKVIQGTLQTTSDVIEGGSQKTKEFISNDKKEEPKP